MEKSAGTAHGSCLCGGVVFTVDLPFDSAAGALVATRAVCLTAGG